jgi:hypothetical protein
MLVTYDERVVGEVVFVRNKGYVYKHFKFHIRESSPMWKLDELLLNIDKYLISLYE